MTAEAVEPERARSARRSSTLGEFISVHCSLLLACCALGFALGLFGDRHWLLDLFAHFRWQYAAGLAFCAVVFATLRQPLRLTLALIGSVLCVLTIWPQAFSSGAQTERAPTHLKLISANLWAANRDLSRLLEWVGQENPDVLVLLELTPQHLPQLGTLEASYPTRLLLPANGAFGIGLWTRLQGAQLREFPLADSLFPAIALHTSIEGQALRVFAVHHFPPLGGGAEVLRQQQMQNLFSELGDQSANAIVVGDLNATPWSVSFRALSDAGLDPAACWPTPTWAPAEGLGWILGLPIDHALAGANWQLIDRRIGPAMGSDHRPLVVSVVPR